MQHLNITRTWRSNNCAANASILTSNIVMHLLFNFHSNVEFYIFILKFVNHTSGTTWNLVGVTALNKHLGLLKLPFLNFPTFGGRNVNICLHLVIYLKEHFYLYLKSNNLVFLLEEMLVCFFCSFVSKITFLLAFILWWQTILGFFYCFWCLS